MRKNNKKHAELLSGLICVTQKCFCGVFKGGEIFFEVDENFHGNLNVFKKFFDA